MIIYTIPSHIFMCFMLVLVHAIVNEENHRIAYYQFNGRSSWHTDRLSIKVTYCGFSSIEGNLWYYLVSYLGSQFTPLSEDSYPPVFRTMISMLLHALINQEIISSTPYEYNCMNVNFLSWFLNIEKTNLSISRGISFIMDVMLSILKKMGIQIWNRVWSRLKWILWRINLYITIINNMMIKYTHDTKN